MVTFKQRRAVYSAALDDMPIGAGQRRLYRGEYNGNGPYPQHCGTCYRRSDESHAPGCTAETAPAVGRLCQDCLRDISEEPHFEECPQRKPTCRECGADAELDESHAVTCGHHPNAFEPQQGGCYA